MAVHAEEDEVVRYMTEKLKREGRDQGYNLHLVHNNISEDLAFRHIIRLAQHTEAGIYFVHTTAKEGVAAIAEARNAGQPVYGEALHNYLQFTCEDYKKPGGTAIHTYPAIKFADDRDALIAGLMDGRLATTATDEYTTHKGPKLWGDTIETVCGGHNGIETRMPVAFTKFVAERNMSLQRFVDITSANAAKLLGLYPRKGAIQPGSDADLVLIDPDLNKTLTMDDLHADSDYSIWEGFTCQGLSGADHAARQGDCRAGTTGREFDRRPMAQTAGVGRYHLPASGIDSEDTPHPDPLPGGEGNERSA